MCKGAIPIPGITTMKMAEDNLGALQWKLTAAEEAALDDASARSQGKMVQNIFQTA
jgi:pyridoxine 4-dehydrogenase